MANVPCNPRSNCYFGCKEGGVLHHFPRPDTERFNSWKEIICDEIKEKGNIYIYNQLRLCDKHFESYYKSASKKLTRNAVPTLHLKQVSDCDVPAESSIEKNSDTEIDNDCEGTSQSESTESESTPLSCTEKNADITEIENGCDCDDPLCTVTETTGIGVVRTVYVVEEIETSHKLTNNHDYAVSSDKVPSQSILKNYYESTAAQIKDDKNVTQKKDVTNSKIYMNVIERLNKKIVKLKRKCTMQAKLISKAKRALAAKPFPKSIENLPPTAKMFVKMQLKAKTKAKGRSFTVEEKIMAASIMKLSPRWYNYLSKLLVLPSKRTIQRILKSSTSTQIS